jgi:hypothetical protein
MSRSGTPLAMQKSPPHPDHTFKETAQASFLPTSLPAGFQLADHWIVGKASGEPLPNPWYWNIGQGTSAGYGVTFTNGASSIVLWVSPAADYGLATFEPTDIALEGKSFSRMVGGTDLQTRLADGTAAVVNGSASYKQIAAVAKTLMRVE